MIELLVLIPSGIFVWYVSRGNKGSGSSSTQTEPGIWLPVLTMDFDGLPDIPPCYDSEEDVVMTPVDSQEIMTYRDYCA